ncbi:YibE/F family protein [Metabacillus sediminilitoris]|uniref:YibE/F family protein n=1 Tax=Metabacillus sediminilitoris TaxID=2567941 RepID=A0A4S4C1R6_9BACI|nr:YibE/F family protein [Metabacillus sediminilitoris]QGQ48890.1 YibE/F family protein [Metabacillus sediminilitoris]THF81602.1 YibE/F family protein [Metabacillus sediminilitoris]
MTYKQIMMYATLAICFVASIIFVNHNYSFYDRPIAKVIKTELEETTKVTDLHNNEDRLYNQHIIAELKNGEKKGELIHLTNEYSASGAFDQEYQIGNEVFVLIDPNTDEDTGLTGTIKNVKRDKYVLFIAWIFIFSLLIVGKKQGLFSIISLAVNAIILSYALDAYLKTGTISLLVACGISVILFTVISLLLVNGFNEKTYAAIVATLLATFVSLIITYGVMWLTAEEGLRYEEMQFLTRPYKMVFMAGILIGSLGAVMDVAITMSSSIFGLYEKNNHISIKALKASGMEIGKDVMGTMTNILFFAYISGSIPMLILYMKNGSPLGFTLSMNLSLELARALAGGIGIVLTIPIGLYISIFLVNRKKARL